MQDFFYEPIRNNNSRIAAFLRRKFYHTESFIDTDVFIKNAANFTGNQGSALYHACYILNDYGSLSLGKNSHLGAFCYVNVLYGSVLIGDDVAIGPGTKIISYSNHYELGRKVTETKVTKDIIIRDNVLIGANCTILPSTIIPKNVIVGAGSVIKGELEENSIYGGVPCKKIKDGWYE